MSPSPFRDYYYNKVEGLIMDNGQKTAVMTDRSSQILSNHVKKMAAFMGKYEGMSSKEIGSMIGCTESTIASYFSRYWRNDYQEFADAEDCARLEIARSVLKHNMVEASRTLVRLMRNSNPHIQLAAAKEILNRTVPVEDFLTSDSTSTLTVERLSVEKRVRNKGYR
jgi:hypothetical protein